MTSRRRLLKLLAAGAAMGAALLRRAAAAGNQLRRDDSRECDIRPQDLRLEWRAGPIGVESRRPRLTWTLAADPLLRGVKQSACQVILASSKDAGSLRPLPLRVGRGSRLLAQEETVVCMSRSQSRRERPPRWRSRRARQAKCSRAAGLFCTRAASPLSVRPPALPSSPSAQDATPSVCPFSHVSC